MPLTDHRLPAPVRVAAGARSLATVAMHLLERQVAGIPAHQQNPFGPAPARTARSSA